MAIDWPATVAEDALEDGYSEQEPNNLVRQPTDSGPPKVRRRGTAAPAPVSFRQNLSTAEIGYLITFYRTTLKYGALEFTRKHPRTGSDVTMLYAAPPAIAPAPNTPGRWIVAHQVEVLS
ncbi:MAG: hypothetical protein MUC33_01340 [Desulfobacterales bacterium]|jgi:hypothetical protein|nr:hypothetical protein [Desulfobacterales bacterium]MCU0601287.1 hypothetical protein [Desulfobacterales bacterium]